LSFYTFNGEEYIQLWSLKDEKIAITNAFFISGISSDLVLLLFYNNQLVTTSSGKILRTDIFRIKYSQQHPLEEDMEEFLLGDLELKYELADNYKFKYNDAYKLMSINFLWLNYEVENKNAKQIILLAYKNGDLFILQ
jgi:hypothetical protein